MHARVQGMSFVPPFAPPERLTVTLSFHTRGALQCLAGEDLLYSLSF